MKKILNWFRQSRMDGELDRELQYHFERRVSDLVREGLSEVEAKGQVNREMGGLTQVREEVRDVWLTRWLRDFVYDLRHSARDFVRNPTFTATVVLSLALGIGATTALYSLVDQVFLHGLPVRDAQRLVLFDWTGERVYGGFGSYNILPYPWCADLKQQEKYFEGVFCRAALTVHLATGANASPAVAEIVSGSYFPVLGVVPAMGRLFGESDEGLTGANPIVVVSHEFWQVELGGARDVVGRKLMVNGKPMTIAGVAAEGFRGIDVGEVPKLWIPSAMAAYVLPPAMTNDATRDRTIRWVQILGRLREGVRLEEAQRVLRPWFRRLLEEDTKLANFPKITAERRERFLASQMELSPAPQGHSRMHRTMTQPLWMLFGATGVLLALACLNVAGLFLARGFSRGREIQTRFALGASRGRIARQLFADSTLLALAGGLLGIGLAPLVIEGLIAFLPKDAAGTALRSSVDARLLTFAFGVSLVTGLLAGFAPALQAGRSAALTSMRERGGSGGGGMRLRRGIVTAQIALTLVLLIGAALFARSLGELLAKGPGFETASLVAFGIEPQKSGYSQEAANRMIAGLQEKLGSVPGVSAQGMATYALLNGGSWNNPMTIQAKTRYTTEGTIHLNAVSPGFFAVLGARIVAGRDFEDRDRRAGGESRQKVAVVNEAFAKKYLAGQNPLGVLVGIGSGTNVRPDFQVVGVVSDVRYRSMREDSEQVYFPVTEDSYFRGANFYLKVRGNPEAVVAGVRQLIREADPAMPPTYFRTLEEQVKRSLSMERMLATLTAGFAVLALLLSLVGLYGVMSYSVTQRTKEIGIRMALGATRGSAVWMVLRDALVMIAGGIAIALPFVWGLGKYVEAQLYAVKATDPLTIGAATLVLCTAAALAAIVPARDASAVDPGEALRGD